MAKGGLMPTPLRRSLWRKVIAGLRLILIEVKNHIHPAGNLSNADNQAEQIGMNTTMVALILTGCWLVYGGIKPMWRKTS
jgi:hypothetical protein